ncbi:hypothetical protein MMC34_001671 [Xylographa carneopallida]|nr:hypothetical protein [Xylographa carneopallida]
MVQVPISLKPRHVLFPTSFPLKLTESIPFIAAFRAKLAINPPPTFDFINAPLPSLPAAGIDLFYSPPYYSFYNSASFPALKAAQAWLLDYVAKHGPYDAVMTFSQGGVLASSVLLSHFIDTPHLAPPFKLAVFLCSGLHLSILDELDLPVGQKAWDLEKKSRQALATQASSEAILARGHERWTGIESAEVTEGEVLETDVYGLDFTQYPKEWRIKIPTVHVYGKKDPRCPASIQLAWFCEAGKRREYDHGAGHEVPRKRDVSTAIAEAVEWGIEMAGKGL